MSEFEFASSNLTAGQLNALVKRVGGDEVVRKILSGAVKVVVEEIKELLLALVSTVPIPARTTKFVIADELSVGNHNGLKIAWQGDNFKEWFGKKVEEPTDATELVIRKLTRYAYDTEIVQALGGDEKAETAMSELASLLKKQGNGQEGVLRTDGYANIAYVRDIKGILRAVYAYWYGDGWLLNADAVHNPIRWDDGDHVVSRK